MVKHSRHKDQFQNVAIKRMIETQVLEDKLKEVSKLNSILLAQKQELEAKLAKESQAKDGNYPINSLFSYLDHVQVNSELTGTLFYSLQGSTHGPLHYPW
jgi:hypothetical protein